MQHDHQYPAERLAEVFVEVADTLVDEFDLIEFLQMLTAHDLRARRRRAAGLLLADHQGRLQLMAASDERAQLLELFQVQAHEGPCQDCFRRAIPVVNADLRGGRRPLAPLRAARGRGRLPVGARLPAAAAQRRHRGAEPLRHRRRGASTRPTCQIVQALADVATIGLLQERAIRRGEVLTEQLQSALNSRIVIEQAKGALAQIHSCTPDEAFERIRTYCRRNNLRLGEVAQAVDHRPRQRGRPRHSPRDPLKGTRSGVRGQAREPGADSTCATTQYGSPVGRVHAGGVHLDGDRVPVGVQVALEHPVLGDAAVADLGQVAPRRCPGRRDG